MRILARTKPLLVSCLALTNTGLLVSSFRAEALGPTTANEPIVIASNQPSRGLQAAIKKANQERQKEYERIFYLLSQHIQVVKESLAAMESELEGSDGQSDYNRSLSNLKATQGQGEVARLERMLYLLKAKEYANSAERQVINAQLEVLGPERDLAEVANKLRYAKLGNIEAERKAALEDVDRREHKQNLILRTKILSSIAKVLENAQTLVQLLGRYDATIQSAKIAGNDKALNENREMYYKVKDSIEETQKAYVKAFTSDIFNDSDESTGLVKKLKSLNSTGELRLPSVDNIRQGIDFKTK